MTAIPTLETERLILRATRVDDFEAYADFYQSERSHHRGGPLDRSQAWEMFAAEVGHWVLRGYGLWSVDEKSSGAYCGLVGLYNPEGWPAPEVGWLVWEHHEGKGIAREAAIRARSYAFETLAWPQVASCIPEGNDRSIRLAERLGASFDRRVARAGGVDLLVYVHPLPGQCGLDICRKPASRVI